MLRSARRIALSLSVTLTVPSVVAFMPASAWAQAKKPIREQLPLEARGHWDAGVALAQRGKWDPARTSFKAAYDMSKNPRVRFNIGVAEKELGRYAAALEQFKLELAEGKGQLTPEEENSVKATIAGLSKFVGELTIDVSEKGADVYIDDDKVDSTKLPGPITVSSGTHNVKAVKAGFIDATKQVQIAGEEKASVSLKLQSVQVTSWVNINVIGPPNAIVKIDKKEVGPAPYRGQVPVQADPHEFSAEAPGFVTTSQSAVVKDGQELNLTLQLAAEQQKGKLLIVAKPQGAVIEIDGRGVGATRWEGPVDAGTHQIGVKKQGYYPWTYDVDVPKGGERALSANLNEDRNTSFVPWLIGTIVVGTALTVGLILIATPADKEPVDGTLSPYKVPTTSLHSGGGAGAASGAGFHF